MCITPANHQKKLKKQHCVTGVATDFFCRRHPVTARRDHERLRRRIGRVATQFPTRIRSCVERGRDRDAESRVERFASEPIANSSFQRIWRAERTRAVTTAVAALTLNTAKK